VYSEPVPPCFACLYEPPAPDPPAAAVSNHPAGVLASIAQEFSPRYERCGDRLIAIDVRGLERLLGTPRIIAQELRREAADRGVRVHVAIAGTHMAALVLALARPGITVVAPGDEAAALAPLSIRILESIPETAVLATVSSAASFPSASSAFITPASSAFKRWGIRTLGELAALPPADLAARLGPPGLACQAIARGEDVRPLAPTLADERFESSLELEWPIDGFEPLSFVLTRLLEPLATRLERRDRAAAAVHVSLRLVTKAVHARRLELPAPLREVRTLRTLLLLDLESHPPPAGIEVVSLAIDPTPGWVLQHKLFARSHPTSDELSTLLARLGALMGQDRIGQPALVDSYRPGAFAMQPFDVEPGGAGGAGRSGRAGRDDVNSSHQPFPPNQPHPPNDLFSALRRFRRPVAARVMVEDGCPIRVTTDRRGFAGGSVTAAAGPWRTAGAWWADKSGRAGRAEGAGREVGTSPQQPDPPYPSHQPHPPFPPSWDHDEWDVALSDGAVYRLFRDRESGGWFIDGIVD
jgi:protein ImuB